MEHSLVVTHAFHEIAKSKWKPLPVWLSEMHLGATRLSGLFMRVCMAAGAEERKQSKAIQ
jgi:hypothetical protein